ADTTMDGRQRLVSISGSNSDRVISVRTNVNLSLLHLTIAEGRSDNGGGIFNAGGRLSMLDCSLRSNAAVGSNGAAGSAGTNAYGGALYNLGFVSCVNCSFISNSATGGNAVWANSGTGSPGGDGLGGAIANFGTLIGTGCLLASNAATGGAGGQGASSMQ